MIKTSVTRYLALLVTSTLWSIACDNTEFQTQAALTESTDASREPTKDPNADQLAAVPLPVDGTFLVPGCQWDASKSSEIDLAVACRLETDAIAGKDLSFSFQTDQANNLAKNLSFRAAAVSIEGNMSVFGFLLTRAELDGSWLHIHVKAEGSGLQPVTSTLDLVKAPGMTVAAVKMITAAMGSLNWSMPCTPPLGLGVGVCAVKSFSDSLSLTGDPGTIFQLNLNFRGRVEVKQYVGGTSASGASWMAGGSPSLAHVAMTTYKLEIDNPPQVFYLNHATSLLPNLTVQTLDYPKDVKVAGGAKVTWTADSGDRIQLENTKNPNGSPLTNPAQFLQMKIIGISLGSK